MMPGGNPNSPLVVCHLNFSGPNVEVQNLISIPALQIPPMTFLATSDTTNVSVAVSGGNCRTGNLPAWRTSP
jgi:hypothetical protein